MDGIKVTKKGLKAYIKYKLSTNDKWALKALLAVYDSQCEDEQFTGSANRRNGVGFNKVDASQLTVLARRYKRKLCLYPHEMAVVKKKIPKYWEQILNKCDEVKLHSQYRRYVIAQERMIENV